MFILKWLIIYIIKKLSIFFSWCGKIVLHVLFLFYKIHVIKCKTLIPKAPVSAVTHFPKSILSLKSKYWAQIYELSFKGCEFRNGYFKMWATVGPDHIYFSNNKKCIIYNTLYLIIHRVYVAAILIGFILKCHISLNFRLKLIGKLFFGHLSLQICPSTSNLKTDSTKTAYGT